MEMAFDPKITLPAARVENPGKADRGDAEALKGLCRDFEAILIQNLFRQMRKTIPASGYLEHGMRMQFFEEIMDTEAARQMARGGGFGLGRLLYEQLQDLQSKP